MKILWISHLAPYPPKGGVTQRSYHLLREVGRKNEVIFVGLNQKAFLPTPQDLEEAVLALQGFCRQVHVLPFESFRNSLEWYCLVGRSLFSSLPYKVHWTQSQGLREKIREIVSRERIDLAHFDTISLAEYLPETAGIPRVLNHHNIESHMMIRRARKSRNLLPKGYFWQEGWKLRQYEKIHCPEYNCNVVVSDLDGERLQRICPGLKTETVANGVDLDYYRIEQKIEKGMLIFAGGMSWYPNRDAMTYFFREVWPRLSREIEDLSFTLIGQNPPPFIRRLAEKDKRIRVMHWVDDVRPYFARAEIAVCPMRDGGGTKLKILDNLAMEKAVVATPLAVEGIRITPGKEILIAHSSGEFVASIKRVLGDSSLRMRLGAAGRRLMAEDYSWPKIGQKLNQIYEKTVCTRE